MHAETDSRTSASLLARLRAAPADQVAWAEFVDRYGRKVYGWCRHWGLQEADAQDVTQDVLVRLAGKMRGFVYDSSRSFRAWLKTLARHALSDFCDARGRAAAGGSQAIEMLHAVEAREDFVRRLEDEFDHEVYEEALARVRAGHAEDVAGVRATAREAARRGGRRGVGDERRGGVRRARPRAEDVAGRGPRARRR